MTTAFDPIPRVLEAELTPLYDKLDRDPTDHMSLQWLYDRYQGAGLFDRACCVAEAMTALHKASPGQALLLDLERPKDRPVARRPLDEAVLRAHVAHPDQDPYITAVLALIAPAVAVWRAVSLPGSLDPRTRVDVSSDPSDAARMIKDVARTLGVCTPDVFFLPEEEGDCILMNLQREHRLHPTLVLFGTLLGDRKEPELAFTIGRAMADLYHPHYGVVALDRSPQALRQVLRACLFWVGHPMAEDHAALEMISAEIMGRMQPAARERLTDVLRLYIEAGASLEAKRWVKAAEYTACRLGLLMAADLRSAARALEAEPTPLCASASVGERRLDLLRYGVSEDYFIARHALGIDVTVGTSGR